jgi:K+-transporting ATPase ATPase B chain
MTMTTTQPGQPGPGSEAHGVAESRGLFDGPILRQALIDSFKKLNPAMEIRNPVMFVVLVGTVITFIEAIAHPGIFTWSITIWLFLTVIFANFAEGMAEGRGKAQADTLRRMRSETEARRLRPDGTEELVPAAELAKGDLVVCEPGDLIPSDGEITEGIASVDESAITGESAPVIRESGGDRSAVTGGTKVLSDRIVVRITAERGQTFLDRMITLVEGANRQKTPNEIALTILLAVLTIVFIPVVVTLQAFGHYSGATVSVVILISLLVCLIPTTIGALLSAIGIAGMDRLVQRNVLAMSGRAVEAAGDVQTLLLDKTGTITLGNRMASDFYPVGGHTEQEVADVAQLASLADETPEGRSIVVLAKERFNIRERELEGEHAFVPFTAQTRMSGLDVGPRQIRKGAAESVKRWVGEQGGTVPADLDGIVERVSRAGSTPLVVSDGQGILGVIELKDVVKQGIREKFDEMRQMGIRTVMITGDNPLTAAAIAQEAGVDDFLAEATPEAKMALIKAEQEGGKLRRGRGHEHRDHRGQRGRQHGRPRLQPDQAHRRGRDRQAAPHHQGIAHHVLHRQRRGQVLRHRPGPVHCHLPAAQAAQHHASAQPAERGALRGHLQCPGDRGPHPAGSPGGQVPCGRFGGHPAPQRVDLRGGRDRRSLHLHQAHRSRPRRAARLLMESH